MTSVDCDHTVWKSWKLVTQAVSPTPSLFVAQRPFTYSQRNMEKFLGRLEWRGQNVACMLKHNSGNISETRKDRGKVDLGTQQRSFKRYHPPPPTASSSPRLGVRNSGIDLCLKLGGRGANPQEPRHKARRAEAALGFLVRGQLASSTPAWRSWGAL